MTGNLLRLTLAIIVIAGAATAAQAGLSLFETHRENITISDLAAGQDRAVASDAEATLQVARGAFLLAHGRPEDAQSVADRMASGDRSRQHGELLYNLGNFMLRRGLAIYVTHPMRETAPLLRIAQAEYRAALHDDPDNWDARFNLDIVNALVRDDGAASPTAGTRMAPDKAMVPDEPGAPSGLP